MSIFFFGLSFMLGPGGAGDSAIACNRTPRRSGLLQAGILRAGVAARRPSERKEARYE
jgi:hypothetical protein